jgi:hypothetical protein
MKIISIAIALSLTLPAASLHAQAIGGTIAVHSGPVSARVGFGSYPYYPPQRRVVVVHDYAPRLIVVRRLPHRGYGYWRHRGYGTTTLWYDDQRDCFYSGPVARYPGLSPVEVYEREGSYYRVDQDREDRNREGRGYRGHSDWAHGGR